MIGIALTCSLNLLVSFWIALTLREIRDELRKREP